MSRTDVVTAPTTTQYDDCRISSCLKSLFSGLLKSKTDARVTIMESVTDAREALERINSRQPIEMSFDYLLAMERSMPSTSFRYVVISKNDKPVLFTYFQLFTLTSRNFDLEKNSGAVKHILKLFLDIKRLSVLISGNAMRNDTPAFCYDNHVISKEEATELISSVGEKIAADECVTALILKDVPTSGKIEKWLSNAGFDTPWKDMVMAMDINEQWQNIDGYVNDLSRKYKTRAKKILAAGESLSVREITETELRHYGARISRLFKNVSENQSFVLASPAGDHFLSMKQLYKDDFEVQGFFDGNELIAFYTAFVSDDSYEVYYVGIDYDRNNECQLYFNLLFSSLERAIALGKKSLKLGRTSFDAKASLGAKPVEQAYFYKGGNISRLVSKWFAKYFSGMEDAKWKLRNPLKYQ